MLCPDFCNYHAGISYFSEYSGTRPGSGLVGLGLWDELNLSKYVEIYRAEENCNFRETCCSTARGGSRFN